MVVRIFFLNTINLICRSTDISKCFRGSLRFRDNESRLHSDLLKMCMSYFCRSNYNHVKTCVLKSTFTEPQNTMRCQQFRCSFIKGYIKVTYLRTKLHFSHFTGLNRNQVLCLKASSSYSWHDSVKFLFRAPALCH